MNRRLYTLFCRMRNKFVYLTGYAWSPEADMNRIEDWLHYTDINGNPVNLMYCPAYPHNTRATFEEVTHNSPYVSLEIDESPYSYDMTPQQYAEWQEWHANERDEDFSNFTL